MTTTATNSQRVEAAHKARLDAAHKEMRRLWPIVTDWEFDAIEEEAGRRIVAGRCDPLTIRMLTAMRSLRHEIAKKEHAWLTLKQDENPKAWWMMDSAHKMRLLEELAARDRAIEILKANQPRKELAA